MVFGVFFANAGRLDVLAKFAVCLHCMGKQPATDDQVQIVQNHCNSGANVDGFRGLKKQRSKSTLKHIKYEPNYLLIKKKKIRTNSSKNGKFYKYFAPLLFSKRFKWNLH